MKAWPVLGHPRHSGSPLSCPLVRLFHLHRLLARPHSCSGRRSARHHARPGLQLRPRLAARLPFPNAAVRFLYWIAAVWLGFLNFFFWASCLVLAGLACVPPVRTAGRSRRSPPAVRRRSLRPCRSRRHLWPVNARIRPHPPHDRPSSQSSRVLARPHGGSAQRPAPGQHQRRPILPPHGRPGRQRSIPISSFFPATFSTAPMAISTACSRPFKQLAPPSASISPPATTRNSRHGAVSSKPSRAPASGFCQ